MSPRWWRRTPVLSVVVPVYNVAEYVEASLASVLRQPLADIEVVAVDDGSTDGSAEIVERIAAVDDRVRLIRQPNSGVSIARNTALEVCTGEYLTFVDPDDELPADAWSVMLRTLKRTRSDFVVGSAERIEGEGEAQRRFITPLMARNHREERLGIRIEDQPLMLADVFVWNKIFRRDFWVQHRINFPERTRYQDQVALTEAFLAARRFDVLTEVVYDWRVRGDLSSATQKRAQLSNLRERMTTKRMTLDLVRAHGSAEVTHVLLREVLPIDMWEHFRAAVSPAVEQPEEYWRVLRDGLRELWADLPFHRTAIPVGQRLMGWLVAHDRRDDLAALIAQIDSPGGVPVEGGEYLHPWRGEPGLPPELLTTQRPTASA